MDQNPLARLLYLLGQHQRANEQADESESSQPRHSNHSDEENEEEDDDNDAEWVDEDEEDQESQDEREDEGEEEAADKAEQSATQRRQDHQVPKDEEKENAYNQFRGVVKEDCGLSGRESAYNLHRALHNRQLHHVSECQAKKMRMSMSSSLKFMPSKTSRRIHWFSARGFCGQFSDDGKKFMCASQENNMHIFDTNTWKIDKTVDAEVSYSIIDTAFSPNKRFVVYSTWSNSAYLVDTEREGSPQRSLVFQSTSYHFCIFSIKFSPNNKEVIAGCNDGNIYIYDLERSKRTTMVQAHSDDVNTVCFSSESANIFFSGGDDYVCKVWDRRSLRSNKPQGYLVGHGAGITHVSSKGDDVYLISNGKDHQIKLWDVRRLSQSEPPATQSNFDYRFHLFSPTDHRRSGRQDTSIQTYKGHLVRATLIRAYFSPTHTTGQRYIYCGSADGKVFIYDVLTGNCVKKLSEHTSIVRDVSWHPFDNTLASTGWDGQVLLWE